MIIGKKIVATIEARMASTRLPGKVLLPFGETTVLEFMIQRLKRSRTLDQIIVATTINPQDEVIVDACNQANVPFYRGSEEDVLKRLVEAGKYAKADIIVEITADCPLIDWRHVDYLVKLFFSKEADYAANIIERSFPDGFDVQVFPLSILEEVEKITKSDIYREHPSYYIYSHPEKYRLVNWSAKGKMYWPELRVTLDTKEDYEVIKKIVNELLSKNRDFSALDVLKLLQDHPEWIAINSMVLSRNLTKPKTLAIKYR